MCYVASYVLAGLSLRGNASPSAKDIKKILDSVGIEADDDRLNKVISELNGKNIGDVIAQGRVWGPLTLGIGKLASVPAGRAVAVSAAPGSAAPAAGSAPAAAEEKKDEKKEESDDDMGFGLFD
ncbi:large ribosomal subunit protein P2-like [Saccopteryx leptura]|uniref:large ribosomal subunit protein P2-like n=1 Tax=Saccopteryx leptura TaxID=249018 RepID=UPI00339BAA6D